MIPAWLLAAEAFGRPFTSMATGGITSALAREFESITNTIGPTVTPSVEHLIKLFYTGRLDDMAPYTYQSALFPTVTLETGQSLLTAFALQHGVDFRTQKAVRSSDEIKRVLWRHVLKQERPTYPPPFLRKLLRSVRVDYDDQAADGMRKALDAELRAALKKEGFPGTATQDLFIGEREEIAVQDVLLWYRLGIIDDGMADALLEALGFKAVDRPRILLNRYRPINEGEMVEFAIRHALDESFATRWDTDNLKPDWWDTWAARNGLNYLARGTSAFGSPPVTEAGSSATGPQTTVGDAVWRAHWRMPSLGDMARLLHRVRGNPDRPETWNFPPTRFTSSADDRPDLQMIGSGIKPLTLDEANTFMDANGVPPVMRAYLYQLMYEPPSKRELHAFIRAGATNLDEVSGWLMDNGMRPDLARRMAAVMFAEEAERRSAPIKRLRDTAWTGYVKAVEDAYDAGALDRVQAESGLAGNNVPADVIKVRLDTIDIDRQTAIVKAVVERTRADWFSGRTDELEARIRLGKAGIPDPRIDQLIATWKASRGQGHTLAGTDKVLKWYRKGYLSRGEVIRRLDNLQWSRPDMLLLLADVDAEMKTDQAKVLQAAADGKRAEIQAAERSLEKMMKAADGIMTRLRRIRPKADVAKWFKAGRMSEEEARQTLRFQGYDEEWIDNFLLDALEKKGKAADQAGGKPKGGKNGQSSQ